MISIGATLTVTVGTLTDEVTGTAITGATVTGSLVSDDRETELTTFSLSHVSGGTYRGTIPASVTEDLVEGTYYRVMITADSSGNILPLEERDVAGWRQSE